jgi:hypothetical protein
LAFEPPRAGNTNTMPIVIVRRHGVFVSQQSVLDDGIDPLIEQLHAEPDQDGLTATILQDSGQLTRIVILASAQ